MKKFNPIENILQDILDIEKLLKKYYSLCIKCDLDSYQKLTEAEIFYKEEIINDLQSLIERLTIDIEKFGQTSCISIEQKINIDKNLIDLVREVKYTFLRLKRFSQLDEDLQKISSQLNNEIITFKNVLQQYIEKSPVKVKDWIKAQEEASKEEENLKF